MTMNVRRVIPGVAITAGAGADIARIDAMWSDCLTRYGGPFLLGAFSVADAMYSPVVTRFKTYAVKLSDATQGYANRVLALPAMQEWYAAALTETEVLPQFEYQGSSA